MSYCIYLRLVTKLDDLKSEQLVKTELFAKANLHSAKFQEVLMRDVAIREYYFGSDNSIEFAESWRMVADELFSLTTVRRDQNRIADDYAACFPSGSNHLEIPVSFTIPREHSNVAWVLTMLVSVNILLQLQFFGFLETQNNKILLQKNSLRLSLYCSWLPLSLLKEIYPQDSIAFVSQ